MKKIAFKMLLPNDIYQMKTAFDKHGRKLYVVGGAVRDVFLGITPHDYDLVTDAQPEESKKILKDFNVSDEQGKNFGVLRIFTKDEPLGYELATFRKDLTNGRDTKGDDQKVEFGNHITIEDDVKRRDLTVNALFFDIDENVIVDLVDGIIDIKNNIISAVGNASERFLEDRLRILRVFRFASRNLSTISLETGQAINQDNRLRGISKEDDVSQERIIEEIIKTVEWAKANNNIKSLTYYFSLLNTYCMFSQMFPGLDVDTTNIETFDLVQIFAMLFINNDISLLKIKLGEFKVPSKFYNTSLFLLRLRNEIGNDDKIMSLFKEKKRFEVSDKDIIDFSFTFDLDYNFIKAFLKFRPTVDANQLKKTGFYKEKLGKEILRLEIENFKKLLKKEDN